jgi:hypothetical protein
MRGSLLAVLALGILVCSVNAQDLHWRPAGTQQPFTNTGKTVRLQNEESGFATVNSKVQLLRPVSVPNTSPAQSAPVRFRPVEARPEETIIKIKYLPTDSRVIPVGAEIRELPAVPDLKEVPDGNSLQTLPSPDYEPVGRLFPVPADAGSKAGESHKVQYQGLPAGEIRVDDDLCSQCGIIDGGVICGSEFWGHSSACPVPRFYASGEYLLWGIKDPNLPPVATTTGLSMQQIMALAPTGIRPGAIGQPATEVLLGGDDLDSPMFSGGRFTVGFSRPCRDIGIEGTFFFLGERSTNLFTSSGPDRPFLFLPFFDTNAATFGENAQAVGIPGIPGFVSARHTSRMWGAEANLRKAWWCDCNSKLDLLGGFRFVELTESFILERNCGCPLPPGGVSHNSDLFGTRNRFYGGQIGADYEYRSGRWILGAAGKIGLGVMHQSVLIDGMRLTILPNQAPIVRPGNFFTAPSNIGKYQRDEFAVVPEVQLKLGYQLTDHLSAHVAYNFLYLSTVARPGDQIDRSFNPRPGGQGPAFVFQDTDFWAQGVNFGLNWRY